MKIREDRLSPQSNIGLLACSPSYFTHKINNLSKCQTATHAISKQHLQVTLDSWVRLVMAIHRERKCGLNSRSSEITRYQQGLKRGKHPTK